MGAMLVAVSLALFVATRLFSTPHVGTVTVSVAHLEPSSGDAMASIPDIQRFQSDTNQTIIIEGKSEAIVGQMAKIPSENGNIADIKTVSEVDNRAGRELLSIISKY
jgi:hypothetical protein